MVSVGEHSYKYPRHGIIVHHPIDAIPYVREATIIMFMHSSYIDFGQEYDGKRLFVFHGGTAYRQNYEYLNKRFNPIVEKCVIQTADLLGKGAKNEVQVLPPVDTENIKPVYDPHKDKPVVAHYPSNDWKGTGMIADIISSLGKEYDFYWEHSNELVSWEENMDRMSGCDIYIDGISTMQEGEKYGEWGVQTLEAMALGKYTMAHGTKSGPCLVNSMDEFKERLSIFFDMSPDVRLIRRQEMRDFVEKNHCHEAVGKKLKENVFEI